MYEADPLVAAAVGPEVVEEGGAEVRRRQLRQVLVHLQHRASLVDERLHHRDQEVVLFHGTAVHT